jgi:hypothetical protein
MSEHVKIMIPLKDDPSGYEAEWIWAEPDIDGSFVVDNSPFSAYGISYRDVIHARLENGILKFTKIKRKGGHRTIRIRLPKGHGHSEFMAHWKSIEAMGCTFEGSQSFGALYSIDVPSEVDVAAVISIAAQVEDDGTWEYEEADVY